MCFLGAHHQPHNFLHSESSANNYVQHRLLKPRRKIRLLATLRHSDIKPKMTRPCVSTKAQITQSIKLRFRRPYQTPPPWIRSSTTNFRPNNLTFPDNVLRDDPEDACVLFETASMSHTFHSTAIVLRYIHVNLMTVWVGTIRHLLLK